MSGALAHRFLIMSERGRAMKRLLLTFILGSVALHAQHADPLEGLWQGYDGEWGHVSRQLTNFET